MQGTAWASGALLLLALFLANAPFFTGRFFLFGPSKAQRPGLLLLELVVAYAAFVAAGMALESYVGQRQPQAWQFYAVSASLFLSMAFPGFVWRYLLKRH